MTSSTKPVVVVFGGSRGIGRACVEALANDGFDVAFTSTSGGQESGLEKAYACDIRDAGSVASVLAQVKQDFGKPIHAVVANAGINVPGGPLSSFPPADFDRLVSVNLVGAFNVLSAAAREVEDGGSILALTTSMVRKGVPGGGPYSATKAAVEALLRSLTLEVAPRRIRVNGVAPGPVDTDLFRAGKNDEALARSAAMSPLNRVGKPEEIASVVAFLLSDKASWVNGQFVQPNGGMI